jgi:hypothetical protein
LSVLDLSDGRATATHMGGLGRGELLRFLDQGARGIGSHAASPADSALARGDAQLAAYNLNLHLPGRRFSGKRGPGRPYGSTVIFPLLVRLPHSTR